MADEFLKVVEKGSSHSTMESPSCSEIDESYFKCDNFDRYKSFDDMNLPDDILRGVYMHSFTDPTEIQEHIIVPMIKGEDVIAQSQSGMGKTGAFVISILSRIDFSKKYCQAIILCHTHELMHQTSNEIKKIGKVAKVEVLTCGGGIPVKKNTNAIQSGVHVMVGTLGRIKHLISMGVVDMSKIKTFVIDEADELLSSRDSIEQIQEIIVKYSKKSMQICLFSATMPKDVLELTSFFMNNPKKFLKKEEELSLKGIKQFYIDVKDQSDKLYVLRDIVKTIQISQCIIYTNSIKRATELVDQLTQLGFPTAIAHGELEKEERKKIFDEFRTGKHRYIVATNLWARGVDIHHVSLVINFDVPEGRNSGESYLHRIGRCGRFGRQGFALNFVTQNDRVRLQHIVSYYGGEINQY